MSTTMSSRIPMALQKVFVSAQRGEDISSMPAPSKTDAGMQRFGRKWIGMSGKSSSSPSKAAASSSSAAQSRRNGQSLSFTARLRNRFAMPRTTAADAARQAMSTKKPSHVATTKEQSTQAQQAAPKPTAQPAQQQQQQQQQQPKPKPKPPTLQDVYERLLISRGYSTKRYNSLETGYHSKPTELQKASYGVAVTQAARVGDIETFRRLITAGLSANPCNQYGESLVHMVCRKGNLDVLNTMIECGCILQVTDDYGRTPLHDACWGSQPNFQIVSTLLSNDLNMFQLMDARGNTPLDYVSREQYPIWAQFFKASADRFWPPRDANVDGPELPPPLTNEQPNTLPIPDPKNALPLELAEMVSSGRMDPEEATYLGDSSDDEDLSETEYDDSDDDDDDDESSFEDSDYYSSDDDDDDDDSDIDPDEMAEFCLRAGGTMAIARKVFAEQQTASQKAMVAAAGAPTN